MMTQLSCSFPSRGKVGMGASTCTKRITRTIAQLMRNQSLPITQVRARSLRRGMTDAERKLWSGLRNEQLGVKFRRQHPLGHYIADFACLEVKLIVELDGSQHVHQTEYDTRRTEFFNSLSFEVMRFPTDLPFTDFQALLACIYNRIEELAALAPIPAFPREGKE